MLCSCTTGLNTPLSVPNNRWKKCNTDTKAKGLSNGRRLSVQHYSALARLLMRHKTKPNPAKPLATAAISADKASSRHRANVVLHEDY
jgi:hypothetical protein